MIARYQHALACLLLSATALAASSAQAQWQPHQIKVGDGQGGQILVPAQIQSPKFPGSDVTLPYGLVEMGNGEVAMTSGVKTGTTTFSAIAFSGDQGATWPEWQSMPATENLLTYLGGGNLSTTGLTIRSFSSDYGRTWPVQIGNQRATDGEIFITEGNEAVEYGPNGNAVKITSFGAHFQEGHGTWPTGDTTGFVRSSTDGGVTWQNEMAPPQWKFDVEYEGTTYTRGVSEGSIVRAANGDLVAALRTDMPPEYFLGLTGRPYNGNLGGLTISISKDDGLTWSELNHLYSAGRHHSHLNLMPNGALVLTMITRLDIRTGLLPDTDQVGSDALVSFDNGLTWDLSRRVTLDQITNPRAFPDTVVGHTGATALSDGSMLSMYGQSREVGGTPVLVKWDPSTAFGPSLELHVNRSSGSTQIVGVGGSNNLDSYTIASASNTASDVWLPGSWNSITDQDGGTWEEVLAGNSTTQLAEVNLSGSKQVSSGGVISLGNIYDTADTEEDLRFTYGLAGNANPRVGLVVFEDQFEMQQYQWVATGGGSWHTASNWLPNANPSSSDTRVLLTGATASTANIDVSQATMVAIIDIDGGTDYRITGQGALASFKLQQSVEDTGEINVMAGDHVFDIPVSADGNANITINSGASLSLDDTFFFHGKTVTKQGGGALYINDNTNSGSGTLRLDGGMLGGSGDVNGDLLASGGVIAPGQSVGTLDIQGYLTVDSGATLQIDIAGPSSHDQLFVGYDANLAGSLEINLLDGYEPNNGDQFLVMIADSVTDSGLTIEGPNAPYFQYAVLGNVLVLTAVDSPATQWTGGASGNWNTASNWSTGVVPNSNQVTVKFAGSAVPATNVQLNSTVTLRELITDDSSSFQVSGSGTIQLDSQFNQTDVVVTGGDHTLNVDVHADVNTKFDIAQGAILSLDDTFDFNGVTVTKEGEGALHINSSTNSGSGTLEVIEGELGGSGDVNGDVVASGGVIAPGQSVGTLDVRGDFTLGAAATLQIELDGPSSSDLLLVNDDADLAGLLEVVLAGGYQPAEGAQFLVMIADNITGSGLTLAGANAANFEVDAIGGTLILTSLFTGLGGDYNEDGVVDAADYTVWADSMGQASAGLAADGDGNGVIEQADYDLWKTHFGNTTASGSEADHVPEPTTLLLALLAMTAVPLRVPRG